MAHSRKRFIGALIITVLAITVGITAFRSSSGTRTTVDSPRADQPAVVEAVEGSDLHRVTLTERASERIGIKTAHVEHNQIGGAQRLVIPYAAVLYDATGQTWAYTNPESLIFVRHPVRVDYIDGELAILSDGPALGTTVVTSGAVELYGAEFGVGH